MKLDGRRTYYVAIAALVGALYLIGSATGQATYANPSGDYSAIVQRVVAGVLLAQAAGFITLRLAIAKLQRTIEGKK